MKLILPYTRNKCFQQIQALKDAEPNELWSLLWKPEEEEKNHAR